MRVVHIKLYVLPNERAAAAAQPAAGHSTAPAQVHNDGVQTHRKGLGNKTSKARHTHPNKALHRHKTHTLRGFN